MICAEDALANAKKGNPATLPENQVDVVEHIESAPETMEAPPSVEPDACWTTGDFSNSVPPSSPEGISADQHGLRSPQQGQAAQPCKGILIESTSSQMTIPHVEEHIGPNLRKKKNHVNASLMTPPAVITPRLTNDPVPANKYVWILHPYHENIVVAQGKSGVAWKSKSKLATDCVIGEQLVQVHRVFVKKVDAMCYIPGDEFKTLDDALPPSTGKHKFLKWDTRHLVTFSVRPV